MKNISIPLATSAAMALGEESETVYAKNVTHGVVCQLPENEPFHYFAWPTVARQADGTLCVVSSGFRRSHVGPWGRTTICKSHDNGATWSYPMVVNNTVLDDRDTGITSLGGQRLAVAWFTSNTNYHYRSKKLPNGDWEPGFEEAGRILDTWTPELIEANLKSYIRVSEDGEAWGDTMEAPVNAPHGFIVLKDGSWFYFGKPWVHDNTGKLMTVFSHKHDPAITAARSTDEGKTWEILGSVPLPSNVSTNQCHEPHAVELNNGDLLGAVRVHDPFRIMLTRSKDGGKTWSTLEETGVMGSPPHLLKHSSGAIVCVYGYREEPYGERAMISYDDGQTWEKNIVIRDDGIDGDLGYPASCELEDGSIFTVYYQNSSIYWSRWNLK